MDLIYLIVGIALLGVIGYLSWKQSTIHLRRERDALKANRSLWTDASTGQSVQSYSFPVTNDSKISPAVLELEKELDNISARLDFSLEKKRPTKEERELLEKKYDELISKITDHFAHETDAKIIKSSLTATN